MMGLGFLALLSAALVLPPSVATAALSPARVRELGTIVKDVCDHPGSDEGANWRVAAAGAAGMNVPVKILVDLHADLEVEISQEVWKVLMQEDLLADEKRAARCTDTLTPLLIKAAARQATYVPKAISFPISYEVRCVGTAESDTFHAIVQLTSEHGGRWRYERGTRWERSLKGEFLSSHRVLLWVDQDDPGQWTWDLELSEEFGSVVGSLTFLQSAPPPARWRNYRVSGTRLD
jgi:putative lipoic acid-binding regulatory protein